MVKALVANPPSLGDCPNFFNLLDLQNHFARVLKWIACPQSQVNGWAGFVLTPAMYSLIDPKPFNLKLLNLPTTTGVPKFPPIYAANGTTVISNTQEQMLCITDTFTRQRNYYDTACNIYRAVYDMLDAHVDDAFKVAPPTTPPTIGHQLERVNVAEQHLRPDDEDVWPSNARRNAPEYDDMFVSIQSSRSA
jgi:hypothetical protein